MLWPVCLAGPLLTLGLDMFSNPGYYQQKLHMDLGLNDLSMQVFNGYKIGPELILINGALVFMGLWFTSRREAVKGA